MNGSEQFIDQSQISSSLANWVTVEDDPEKIRQEPQSNIVLVELPAIFERDSQELAQQIYDEWDNFDLENRPADLEKLANDIKNEIVELKVYTEKMHQVVTSISLVIEDEYAKVAPEVRERPPIHFSFYGPLTSRLAVYHGFSLNEGGRYVGSIRTALVVVDDVSQVRIYTISHELSHAFSDKTTDPSNLRIGFGSYTANEEPLNDNDRDMNEGTTTLYGHLLADQWRKRFGDRLPENIHPVYEDLHDNLDESKFVQLVSDECSGEILLRAYLTDDRQANDQVRAVIKKDFTDEQVGALNKLWIETRTSLWQEKPTQLRVLDIDTDRSFYEHCAEIFPNLTLKYYSFDGYEPEIPEGADRE